ncbi:MAG: HAMP domain-containing protein, partial [Anaerolineae bacterium]|nr:HAMP domain-containing protein [Anaerolineae bacterium]
MRLSLSIRQRTMLSFALMILLVLVASGMGLLHATSVERTISAMRSGAEQIESIANLRLARLAIVATIDNMLLTRQTSLIERQLSGEMEELNRQLDALQAQSWGESTGRIAQNQEIVNNLQVLGNNLSDVIDELGSAVRKGQWARAQFLHHNDLASSERLFDENLAQLSTNVRSDVDASVARSLHAENLLQTYWITTVLAALVAGSIAAFMTFTSILRPISALVAAAQAVRNGNLSQRATVTKRDELGVLADVFNSMTVRLELTIKELRTSEENYRAIFENAVEGIYQTS